MIKNKLGNFVKIRTGKLDANASSPNGEYPFFTCSKEPLKISSYSYDCKCVLVAGNGDLNVKYYDGKFDAYQRTYIIESKDESVLDVRYLYWFLFKYVEKLRELSIGGVIKYIKINNLIDPIIPLPPLEDQKRIVKILNEADALRQKRKQATGLLDDYLKSVFLEMFGDPVKNPKGWKKQALKLFGQIITGNTPPRNDTKNYSSDFIEWIKTDNIVADKIYLTSATEHLSEAGLNRARFVMPGAVLVACIAGSIESIGRNAITNRKVSFNQQINAIQPNAQTNTFFLYWLLKISKQYIQIHSTKGMKRILTKGSFEKIIMIAPPRDVQDKFAKVFKKTDTLKQSMLAQSAELETQFQALMQKAFKGKL